VANEPRLAVESIAGRRDYQEDSLLAQHLSDGRTLVAVADGMGGHAAGEVASALALETLVASLEGGDALDEAFVKANTAVWDKAREPGKKGMGTTLVAALVEDGEYMIANVGDSRGYVLSADGIRQVTHDHSFAAEAERHGQPIAEEMAIRYKDALTRSIGTEEFVQVDVFGPFPVVDDSALFICSDGLYKVLEDDALLRIYLQSSGPRGAAQALVTRAFDDGSDDNISAAIAEYGEVPRTVEHGTMPIDFVPPSDSEDQSDEVAEDQADEAADEVADAPEAALAGEGELTESEDAPAVAAAASTSDDVPATTGIRLVPMITLLVVIGALLAFFLF
jgi:serine/threonine protein phosphatase PrpC